MDIIPPVYFLESAYLNKLKDEIVSNYFRSTLAPVKIAWAPTRSHGECHHNSGIILISNQFHYLETIESNGGPSGKTETVISKGRFNHLWFVILHEMVHWAVDGRSVTSHQHGQKFVDQANQLRNCENKLPQCTLRIAERWPYLLDSPQELLRQIRGVVKTVKDDKNDDDCENALVSIFEYIMPNLKRS